MLVLNFWRAKQAFGLQKENLALFDLSLIIESQYSGDQREKIAVKGRHRGSRAGSHEMNEAQTADLCLLFMLSVAEPFYVPSSRV